MLGRILKTLQSSMAESSYISEIQSKFSRLKKQQKLSAAKLPKLVARRTFLKQTLSLEVNWSSVFHQPPQSCSVTTKVHSL
ncbi:hypothetical protein P9112_007740 [Eukaryota sp. TZLM1-RC]